MKVSSLYLINTELMYRKSLKLSSGFKCRADYNVCNIVDRPLWS